jgi:hypothetical protein
VVGAAATVVAEPAVVVSVPAVVSGEAAVVPGGAAVVSGPVVSPVPEPVHAAATSNNANAHPLLRMFPTPRLVEAVTIHSDP